ncbi:redoxin family protein [Mycolicibacter sinensis]|jgi:thiol-disulfide isomerase/thioredoxin|uniref:Soluble secreted antigen MPT53 n=1 Tax=Mycolicibacter sinensis (strain JDM601) TaxID=875328 RepID=A0A1A2EGD4_MYCSD|nr:redoxin family protein [Mycolicibacter sinensis]OBF98964.1 thiol:disulfide interchange protein [Mycolicibacter sinensis]OBG04623.1 thiol:disulfide interchange protein [Mycolicibacter sinensis]
MPAPKASGLCLLIAVLVAATALLAAGCGSRTTAEGTQLDFTAQTLDGRKFSGSSLHGRPAVLWFWAPWCPTCQKDAPVVARVAAAHPAVTFVGVGARDELSALQDFVAKYGVDSFTELNDADAAVWARFGVTRQPAYAFVSPDGGVEVVKGSLSEADLSARVQALTPT